MDEMGQLMDLCIRINGIQYILKKYIYVELNGFHEDLLKYKTDKFYSFKVFIYLILEGYEIGKNEMIKNPNYFKEYLLNYRFKTISEFDELSLRFKNFLNLITSELSISNNDFFSKLNSLLEDEYFKYYVLARDRESSSIQEYGEILMEKYSNACIEELNVGILDLQDKNSNEGKLTK